jgi:hypothetical protein
MHPLLGQLYTSLDLMLPDVEQLELRVGTATGDLMLLLQTYDEEPPSLEVDFPSRLSRSATIPCRCLDWFGLHHRDCSRQKFAFRRPVSIK